MAGMTWRWVRENVLALASCSSVPEDDDWTAWNAGEMRAAVEHVQRKRGA